MKKAPKEGQKAVQPKKGVQDKAQRDEKPKGEGQINGGKKSIGKKDSNEANWKPLTPKPINLCLKSTLTCKEHYFLIFPLERSLGLSDQLLAQSRSGCVYHRLMEDLKCETTEGGELDRL